MSCQDKSGEDKVQLLTINAGSAQLHCDEITEDSILRFNMTLGSSVYISEEIMHSLVEICLELFAYFQFKNYINNFLIFNSRN